MAIRNRAVSIMLAQLPSFSRRLAGSLLVVALIAGAGGCRGRGRGPDHAGGKAQPNAPPPIPALRLPQAKLTVTPGGGGVGGEVQFLTHATNSTFQRKAQLHSHTERQEDGADLSLAELVQAYASRGYGFLSVTEHDRGHRKIAGYFVGALHRDTPCEMLFEDPHIAGIQLIPGREGGKWSEPYERHMLEIGIKNADSCAPDDFDPTYRSLYMKIAGGFTIAAHPGWQDGELFDTPWLVGLELRDQGNVDKWNALLTADRMMWGFCVDDTHVTSDIGRGWIVLNMPQPALTSATAIERLKAGDFYAVLPSVPEGGGDHVPKILMTTVEDGELVYRVNNATRAELHFRDGVPRKTYEGLAPTDFPQIRYRPSGDEGFVRLELFSTNGNRTFGQPVFVFGRSVEDAIPLDWASAHVQAYPADFYAIEDSTGVRYVFRRQQDAQKALAVIKAYRADRQVFVGRPNPRMKYLTVAGAAPVGVQPNEQAMQFNPAALKVKYVEGQGPMGATLPLGWKIVDEGGNTLESFGDSEAMALRGLEMIKRHGFTHRCAIGGEGELGMVYYRK